MHALATAQPISTAAVSSSQSHKKMQHILLVSFLFSDGRKDGLQNVIFIFIKAAKMMSKRRPKGAAAVVAAATLLLVRNGCHAFSAISPRRSFIRNYGAAIATIATCNPASAAPLPLQTASSGSSSPVRVEEVGGGFDLLSPSPSFLKSPDVFYPSSMSDTSWRVQRVITSVEGDVSQALVAWRSLGGGDERAFKERLTEGYEVKFIVAPDAMAGADYVYEGKTVRSAILDRSFEISHRIDGDTVVNWDPTSGAPNTLAHKRNDDEVELVVVQRRIEPPSETGFGSDELVRIKSSAGGAFKSLSVYRAARVRRRWRRGFDEATGKRVVDGLEIVTTYRVLDGVAGTEMPTSTTKSRIRMVEMQ